MSFKTGFKKFIYFIVQTVLVLFLGFVIWVIAYTHRSNPEKVQSYETTNPFITEKSFVISHRSGNGVEPEETMAAFKEAIENSYEVDAFEFDIHLTADNVLVLCHDSILDRTSNSIEVFGQENISIKEKTYEELRQLNMGAKFVNKNGEMPYSNLQGEEVPEDIRIASLNEVYDYVASVSENCFFLIEIKDDGEQGKRVADALYAMAKDKGLLNRTIIASFYHDVMMYVQDTYPDAYRGASRKEFVTFYFAALFNIKNYHPTFVAMQAPHDSFVDSFGANFATARTLNYAHEHGIALQYWTVNNPNEMRYLVNIKADGIISDYPQTLYDIKKRILGDNV